jgi:hypothetical protein
MHYPFAKPHSTSPSDVLPIFTTNGQVAISNSGNEFIDLSYSIPFIVSNVNTYITSLVSKTLIQGFEPTYFQIPYIYSFADNLINGNYKDSLEIKDNLIITTYKIPYQGNNKKEEIATIVTYFNTETKILWYEIPREFTYNSVEESQVAIVKLDDGSYSGKYNIPVSFITKTNTKNKYIEMSFNINQILINTISNNAISASVKLYSTDLNGGQNCCGASCDAVVGTICTCTDNNIGSCKTNRLGNLYCFCKI